MTMSSPVLKDKVAMVTGASRGIGRAIAAAFAREGAAVAICGRKQETLDRVAVEIAGETGRVYPLVCHVGRPDQIQHLVETTHREFGRIDILVNNAATNIAQEPVLQIDEAEFDKMVEINLKSAFRLIQAIAPGMCSRDWGSIINIASISGVRPHYHGMLYSMTKAARHDRILEDQPIKHLGQPEEIAEIAVLLASDRGSYITGQTVVVDGGRLLP